MATIPVIPAWRSVIMGLGRARTRNLRMMLCELPGLFLE